MNKDIVETVVEILGRTYHIKCPKAEIPALQQSAKYLENKLRIAQTVSQSLAFDRVAVIAALNITHELLTANLQKNQYSQSVDQKLSDLQNKIDEALIRYSQMELTPAD